MPYLEYNLNICNILHINEVEVACIYDQLLHIT
jgi:hypothetical protein